MATQDELKKQVEDMSGRLGELQLGVWVHGRHGCGRISAGCIVKWHGPVEDAVRLLDGRELPVLEYRQAVSAANAHASLQPVTAITDHGRVLRNDSCGCPRAGMTAAG